MPTYETLNKLPAEAFLNPHNFATGFDNTPDNVAKDAAMKQYFNGRFVADAHPGITEIFISANGTWGACGEGTTVTTYEGIGYHSNTAALLLGFLDSGLPVIVYRRDGSRKRIK